MVGQGFGLGLDNIRELLLKGTSDGAVKLCAFCPKQATVGRVSDQRVLKSIDRPWRLAAAEQQLRMHELTKCLVEPLAVLSGYRSEDLERKFTADCSPDLSNL